MYIVLLETSGNQRYIFSTNKLRENVGASELTFQIGTKIVVNEVGRSYDYAKDKDGSLLKKLLFEEKPIEDSADENAVEIIIATSGKALLLTKSPHRAEEIVRKVTKRALVEMPGLTVHGAVCKVNDAAAKSLDEAVGDVHKRLDEIRYQIPSNLQRFQRIPFVAECNTSNLPAEKLYRHLVVKKVEEEKPHSIVSSIKQEALFSGRERLEMTIRNAEEELFPQENANLYFDFAENSRRFDFANNPHRLDIEERFKNTKWFAVIHADGNGLGQIFLDFQKETDSKTARDYIDKYRKLSIELDRCTEKATAFALKNLQTEYKKNNKEKIDERTFEVPAIPLILGGDDMTIICDGQYAIKFTRDFLTKFVEETKKPKIQDVFPKGIDLGICAGIAIIKPHFPFHQAYDLAAELLQSAKKTKQISTSLSAFDYHVLYDSSGTTLDEIRGKTPFVARPYVVTDLEKAKSFVDADTEENRKKTDAIKIDEKKWLENHHFSKLEKRVNTMKKTEDDDETKRKLPNSQMHILREGLFVADTTLNTQKEVDARAKLIAHRYETFKHLFADEKEETLFFDAVLFDKNDDEAQTKRTHFLDALDIVEFWK